jgi:hypothetical protein
LLEINAAIRQKRDGDHGEAGGFGGLSHRRMFACADHNGSRGKRLGAANDGLGDSLGCRSGEHDLLALGAGKLRYLGAGGIEEVAQGSAVAVHGRRIAHQFERGDKRRPRFRQKRGRGIMIKIDRRSRHRFPVWRMRAGHAFHAGAGAPRRLRLQTLLEICRPTSLQGALLQAAQRLKTEFRIILN